MKLFKKLICSLMLLFGATSFAAEKDFSNIPLKDLQGKTYQFAKNQKETYIKLWASWCPVCLSGLEELDTLSKENPNFEVVTIVFPNKKGEKSTADFKTWFSSLGYKNIKVLFDENGEVLKQISPRVYPTSVVLDNKGKVKKVFPGHLSKEQIYSLFPKETVNQKVAAAPMEAPKKAAMETKTMAKKENIKEIYLAGGCFWGVEAYMERIYGVKNAVSGYANGKTKNPKYEDLHRGSGHAETVRVTYDSNKISLETILKYYFKIIDPTSLNKQGNDRGSQYRTGIYYQNAEDKAVAQKEIPAQQRKYKSTIVVEVLPLKDFYPAEEYHQDYLKKNPNGYCHIDLNKAHEVIIDKKKYPKLPEKELKAKLNAKQYAVTQMADTERAFQNDYWNFFEAGIYVDITSGEPLFSSKDKYNSSCGWPSFTKAIVPEVVTYHKDTSFNMIRVEVRSRSANAHLGHVFDDGPKAKGGKRFCINSAALDFIPLAKMEEKRYGYLIPLVK